MKLLLILPAIMTTYSHNIQKGINSFMTYNIMYCFIVISDFSFCLLVNDKFLGNNAKH